MKQEKKLSQLVMLKQAVKQQSEAVVRLEELEKQARHLPPHAVYASPAYWEELAKASDAHDNAALKLREMKAELDQVQAKIETRSRRLAVGAFAGITASLLMTGVVGNGKEAPKTQEKLQTTPIEKVAPAIENEVQIDDTTTTIDGVMFTNDREMQ